MSKENTPYEELRGLVEAEMTRQGGEAFTFVTIDLDGDVATVVWFGDELTMERLKRSLKRFPTIGLVLMSEHADSDRIHDALKRNRS